MTDDTPELSRRKVLGGLGTIGAAGAIGGAGTMAFFSDEETFANNTLTAGSLDLKVDWEEHYSDWSDDEDDDPDNGRLDIRMEEPENVDAYRRFPVGSTDETVGLNPVWVLEEDVPQFMDNTSIEGYPDQNNDGIASFPLGDDDLPDQPICEFLADVGSDDDGLSSDLRTNNEVTDPGDPLINLQDVKPGDFGEITFSTHLCDNDGYLWLNMPGGLTANENGVNEPEAEDEDEDQVEGDGNPGLKPGSTGDKTVELADKLQTAIWYDNNCDNLITGDEPIDLMAIADTSGSIEGQLGNGDPDEEIDLIAEAANRFVDELRNSPSADNIQAGLLTFNGPNDAGEQDAGGAQAVFNRPALRAGLGPLDRFDTNNDGNSDVEEFLPSDAGGNTPLPHALDLAQKVLKDQGRENSRKIILLVADGLPDYQDDRSYTVVDSEGSPEAPGSGASYTSETFDGNFNSISGQTEQEESRDEATEIKNEGIEIFVAGVSLDQQATGGDMFLEQSIASDPGTFFDAVFENPQGDEDLIEEVAEDIAQAIASGNGNGSAGDEVIFTGTLREAEAALTANNGRGIPLDGDRDTPFDELEDPENAESRECFSAATTACFGFSWWLPLNHGNEVQTDSVQFDLGFFTAQCRHNDGSSNRTFANN
jgi:predicted ribosomally synthesized peptide with SipW-like signal peptide